MWSLVSAFEHDARQAIRHAVSGEFLVNFWVGVVAWGGLGVRNVQRW